MERKRKFEQPHVDSDTVAELSKKLIEANKKLKIVQDERKILLENISHDLRAPLTAIRSTIDYMNQKGNGDYSVISSDEMSKMMNLLDSRVRALEVLINDLYYLTSIENSSSENNFDVVPLGQFLEEYFFSVEIDEKYKDNELILDVPEELNAFVRIDTVKMNRVLDNLFTNAMKYSAKGSSIKLGAFLNGNNACVFVKDNGNGISEEDLPHIFERSFRASDSRTPIKEEGNGFGLAIAKAIVKQQGGKIYCKSVFGEGSTFYIELPVDQVIETKEGTIF